MKTAIDSVVADTGHGVDGITSGPEKMDDASLLAHILQLTVPAAVCRQQARIGLEQHGSLTGLVAAAAAGQHSDELNEVCQLLRAVQELLRRQLGEEIQQGQVLTSPAETVNFLRLHLGQRRREVFLCIFLDTRHRVIRTENLFLGSIDGASVYPRVVADHALRHNAAAVIVAHNHPSGVAEPSLADQAITRRLKDALGLLEIRLLDHFIIGHEEPVSMASRGMI